MYDVIKKRILVNIFFKLQFNYCPLIWMCYKRYLNNEIKRLHELCLHIVYNNKKSNFEGLLKRDGSVSTHHQNIRFPAIEMLKFSEA